jgi:hypothetical protein
VNALATLVAVLVSTTFQITLTGQVVSAVELSISDDGKVWRAAAAGGGCVEARRREDAPGTWVELTPC